MSVIIGITGSIASGKTTLLKYVKENGHKIFICDDYVKDIYKKPEIVDKIQALFQDTDLTNRKSIARIIYKDPIKKAELEKIIHPLVREAMHQFAKDHKSEKMIFLEVPLLFESGWYKNCDYTIALLCPADMRLERALGRGIDEDIFKAIDKVQMPEMEKKKRADFSIDTYTSLDKVTEEFEKIIASL